MVCVMQQLRQMIITVPLALKSINLLNKGLCCLSLMVFHMQIKHYLTSFGGDKLGVLADIPTLKIFLIFRAI